MSTAQHHRERLPVLPSVVAIGAGVVWSFGAIMKRLADDTDAFQYLIWRSVGIIIVVEALNLARGRPLQTLRAWRGGRSMVLANFGLFLASIAYVYAVDTTTPANAAFLGSLTPLVAVVFARFLGERLSRSTIVALIVGTVGLVVTVFGDLDAGSMVGNAAALLASVGFALYSTALRTEPHRDWSPVLPGYGLLMIVVCSIVTIAKGNPLVPPAADTAWALFHGGVVIVLGTFMFAAGARHVPAVPMTVFAQAEMLMVPILSWLILDLAPTPLSVVGGLIIFGAIVGKAIWDTSIGHAPPGAPAVDLPLP